MNVHESNNNNNESLKIFLRKETFLEGLKDVIYINDKEFLGKLKNDKILIKGENLKINKLDLEKEFIQISGNINEIKYINFNITNKFKLKNLFHR